MAPSPRPRPPAAQTLYETLNLAADAGNAAKQGRAFAENLHALVKDIAANEPLRAMAPAETALLGERAKAARKAILRHARAHELMAARLRDHAQTLR